MPHLSFPIDPDGLCLTALVGLTEPDTQTILSARKPIPAPIWVRALIDTGCDATALAPDVIRQLGIAPFHRTMSQTASGSVWVQLYRVSLSVPAPGGAVGPMLTVPDLVVTELTATLPDVDALIGMDVVRQCLIVIDGPGKQFLVSF
jgi:aspartyl protease